MRVLYHRGQSLIEIIIVIGISAIILPALFAGFIASREGKAQQFQRLEAIGLTKEAFEAVRSVREKGWSTFAINGTFHPEETADFSWILMPGTETVGGYTRQIEISNVYRDTNGAITLTSGILDPSTKRVRVIVSWSLPFASSIDQVTYVSRFDNLSFIQTTEVDFNAGVKTGVAVINTTGGEVVLGAGGGGDWCQPDPSLVMLDLPKNGVANALSAYEGHVFTATGDNSSGVAFANVAVSNTNPPVPSIIGTFDGYKTNDIFGETNYVYLATDNNAKEIVIIDVSATPYTEVGYFDAPGPADAINVTVVGNIGYMVAGNTLWNFDLTSKSGSRPLIDNDGFTLNYQAASESIVVVNGKAYIPVYGTIVDIQIVDVSNPTNLTLLQNLNFAGRGKGLTINSTGTRAYIINQPADGIMGQFYIVDLSDYSAKGIYILSGMTTPQDVAITTGNRVIVVGDGGENYLVLDISNESNPIRCGGISIASGIRGVDTVLETDGDAYSYIITGDATQELRIIEGGPGGLYSDSGTFESSIFDSGYITAFNRFVTIENMPPGTQIQYQMAVADPSGGGCSGANFIYVGPDGTSASFFSGSSPIPLDDDGSGFENPGQCFRYKAYLSSTDTTSSPIFHEITVNYSP